MGTRLWIPGIRGRNRRMLSLRVLMSSLRAPLTFFVIYTSLISNIIEDKIRLTHADRNSTTSGRLE